MFKKLCSKHNFNNKSAVSHVLMDGGILSVPFDRLDDFYDICIQCIKSGEHIFVVEQKTEIYNFFVDIDYQDDEPLSLEEIKNYSQTIFSKVKSFSNEKQTCIISLAKPKKKNGKIKSGIHLNFPYMFVDQHRAIQLMYHLLHTLGEIYPSIDWPKFIDPAVYGSLKTRAKGSGFRMPWSHKKSKHEFCNGDGCVECNHSGKLTEVSYLPVYMLEKYNITELPIEDPPMKELLWLTTLRTNKSTVECVRVPDIVYQESTKQNKKREGDFTDTQTKNVVVNEILRQKIENFVNKHMKGQESARVHKIFKWNKNFVIETNSHFCENLNKNHSSNRIYFYIYTKDKTIIQKCFCTCETTHDRKYGFCKDFSGRAHFLYPTICEIMFPDNNKKK